jgi:uncharacterized protein YdcH (DUF465 family)
MFNEPHDLEREFPQFIDRICHLRGKDPYFEQLFSEYHKVDKEVLQIAQGVEHTSDTYLETLKKNRVHLKDKLYHILQTRRG